MAAGRRKASKVVTLQRLGVLPGTGGLALYCGRVSDAVQRYGQGLAAVPEMAPAGPAESLVRIAGGIAVRLVHALAPTIVNGGTGPAAGALRSSRPWPATAPTRERPADAASGRCSARGPRCWPEIFPTGSPDDGAPTGRRRSRFQLPETNWKHLSHLGQIWAKLLWALWELPHVMPGDSNSGKPVRRKSTVRVASGRLVSMSVADL